MRSHWLDCSRLAGLRHEGVLEAMVRTRLLLCLRRGVSLGKLAELEKSNWLEKSRRLEIW